jgi:hypothetical protein
MDHICPKCNSAQIKCAAPADSNVGLQIVVQPIKFLNNKSTWVIPYACSNCGFVEWYAENPEKLR